MNGKRMTKEEMRELLEKNKAKIKEGLNLDEEIDDSDLPPGPHFMPTNEVDLQRRKNEITGKKK